MIASPDAAPEADDFRALDGAVVGQGVRLRVEGGARHRSGARHFHAYLDSDELGRTVEPIVIGLLHRASSAGRGWVAVTDYLAQPSLSDGRTVEIPEGIELRIVEALGARVPTGGQLIIEYESESRRTTASALDARVPPAATPLGGMMFVAGCGVRLRDHRTAAGGRAGRRRLAGRREANVEEGRVDGLEMLAELKAFMDRSRHLDWFVQSQTRPIAEATIAALRARYETQPGDAADPS